ncbi:MAG: ABC transporter ATP-binding protein [Pseudomonadota bacterium]
MLLELSEVTKSFRAAGEPERAARPVLDAVDLTLDSGQTLALTGESGCGKSTLLHIAAGLELADAGAVRLDGDDLATLGDRGRAAVRRDRVGIVFQQFNLIPSLTVAQNVAFQAHLAKRYDVALIDALVDRLGLGAHLRAYPETLSGGQQQRVAIARTLAARPRLVLADEPTGNLDEETAGRVLDQMLALVADTGAGLLVVTHSLTVAARMDRQVRLSRGRLA